ncbi:MAG: hypothetical protein U1F83_14575 [Verrucomicrobiota bacterium]
MNFSLKPNADSTGRFAIKLKQPNFERALRVLQPGNGLKVVARAQRRALVLIDQGITVLRQGGCMANRKRSIAGRK